MGNKEYILPPSIYGAVVFDKSEESWERMGGDILRLAASSFSDFEQGDAPVLGAIIPADKRASVSTRSDITMYSSGDIVAYPSLEQAFRDPDTTVVVLRNITDTVVGYSWGLPMDKMDPLFTEGEDEKTFYIYQTIIDPNHRGQKLVGMVIDPLFRELHTQGYTHAERDARAQAKTVGERIYADTVERHFAGTFSEEPYLHDPFGLGEQKHFRINVSSYCERLDQQGMV